MVHSNSQIYQSILHNLSILPADKLSEIDEYLKRLRLQNMTPEQRKENAELTLSFEGMWNNIPDDELEIRLNEDSPLQ